MATLNVRYALPAEASPSENPGEALATFTEMIFDEVRREVDSALLPYDDTWRGLIESGAPDAEAGAAAFVQDLAGRAARNVLAMAERWVTPRRPPEWLMFDPDAGRLVMPDLYNDPVVWVTEEDEEGGSDDEGGDGGFDPFDVDLPPDVPKPPKAAKREKSGWSIKVEGRLGKLKIKLTKKFVIPGVVTLSALLTGLVAGLVAGLVTGLMALTFLGLVGGWAGLMAFAVVAVGFVIVYGIVKGAIALFKAIGKLFKRKKNKNKDKGSGIIIWIPDLDPLPPQPYAFTGYDLPVFGYNTATRC